MLVGNKRIRRRCHNEKNRGASVSTAATIADEINVVPNHAATATHK